MMTNNDNNNDNSSQYANPFATLPPGWTTAADPQDGRLFYWHAASGQSSWTHPNALAASSFSNPTTTSSNDNTGSSIPTQPRPIPPPRRQEPLPPNSRNDGRRQVSTNGAASSSSNNDYYLAAGEDPHAAWRRPDNHQCGAIAALVLCFPLGALALYHSVRVDASWRAGRYSDAVVHARQAPQFGNWGMAIGATFWICWFFFRRGRGEWEWPDWRIGD